MQSQHIRYHGIRYQYEICLIIAGRLLSSQAVGTTLSFTLVVGHMDSLLPLSACSLVSRQPGLKASASETKQTALGIAAERYASCNDRKGQDWCKQRNTSCINSEWVRQRCRVTCKLVARDCNELTDACPPSITQFAGLSAHSCPCSQSIRCFHQPACMPSPLCANLRASPWLRDHGIDGTPDSSASLPPRVGIVTSLCFDPRHVRSTRASESCHTRPCALDERLLCNAPIEIPSFHVRTASCAFVSRPCGTSTGASHLRRAAARTLRVAPQDAHQSTHLAQRCWHTPARHDDRDASDCLRRG